MRIAKLELPNLEQTHAMVAYAEKHGRNWKGSLAIAWQQGSAGPELQQVRNTFGPSWLWEPRVTVLALSVHLAAMKKGAA